MKLHTAEQIEASNKATQQMILAMQQQLLVAMQGGGNVNSPATVSAAAGVGLGHGTQHDAIPHQGSVPVTGATSAAAAAGLPTPVAPRVGTTATPATPAAGSTTATVAASNTVNHKNLATIKAYSDEFAAKFKFNSDKSFMDNKKKMVAEFDFLRSAFGADTPEYVYLVKACIEKSATLGSLAKSKVELIEELATKYKGDALFQQLITRYGVGYISEGQLKRQELQRMKREKSSLKDTLDLFCARCESMELREDYETYRIDEKSKAELLNSFVTSSEQDKITNLLLNQLGEEATAADYQQVRENPKKLLKVLYRLANIELTLGTTTKGALDNTSFAAVEGDRKKKKKSGGRGKKSWDPQSQTNGGQGRDPKLCGKCGQDHPKNQCPYKDYECHYCHEKGHLQKFCHKKAADKKGDDKAKRDGQSGGAAPSPSRDKADPNKGILRKVNFKANAKSFAAMDGVEMSCMARHTNTFEALAEANGWEIIDPSDLDPCNFLDSGALSNIPSTRSAAGEFEAFYTQEEERLYMCVDTGCTRSLLPPGFMKYAVSSKPYRTSITTAMHDQTIVCNELFVCRIPFQDISGKLRHVMLEACITDQTPYPLLAASANMKPRWKTSADERLEAICLRPFNKGEGGVWVPLTVVGKVFAVEIVTGCDAEQCLFAADYVKKVALEDRLRDFNDFGLLAENASLDKLQHAKLSDFERAELFHIRLGHPRGQRLYATLKHYGLNVTRAQCKEIGDRCHVCQTVCVAKRAVPEVTNRLYDQFDEGELCFQDLAFMQHPGSSYIGYSAIVDAQSRRVSAGLIKHKDQAVGHFTEYCKRAKDRRTPVRELRTDNGGEFVNKDYEVVFRNYAVVHNNGAPWTPESQGMIERLNREIKGKLHKILSERGIPNKYWSFFLCGVIQQINATVHSTTGKVPSGKDELPDMLCGDLVLARLPRTGEVIQGYYGGRTSANVDNVITHGQGDNVWRCFRVHPSAIRCVGFYGDKSKTEFRPFPCPTDVSQSPAAEWGVLEDEIIDPETESDAGGVCATGDGVSSSFNSNSVVSVPAAVSPPPLSLTSVRQLVSHGKLLVLKEGPGRFFPAVAIKTSRGQVHFARQKIDGDGKLEAVSLGKAKIRDVSHVLDCPDDGVVPQWVVDAVSPPPVSPPRVVAVSPASPPLGEAPAGLDVGGGNIGDVGDIGDTSAANTGPADAADGDDEPPAAVDFDELLNELRIDDEEPIDVDVVTGLINDGRGHIAALSFTKDGPVAIAFRANTQPSAKAPAKAPPAQSNRAKGNLEVTKDDVKAGKLDQAMLKELKCWADQKVLGPAIPNYHGPAMPCGWVHSLKLKNGERVFKSRMVAHGNRDPRNTEHIATYSGTVDPGRFYVCLIFALGQGWKLLFADVPTAFLRADADKANALVMRLPKLLPRGADKLGFVPGAAHRQQKAIYGTPEAGRLWQMKLLKEATESNWQEFAQALMDFRPNGKVAGISGSHVDDIGMVAKDPLVLLMTTFGEKVGIPKGEITVLKPGESGKYNGCVWTMVDNSTMSVGQKDYAEGITTDLTDKQKRKKIAAHDFKRPAVVEVDMSLQKQQQQVVGVMGWLAKTQRHLAFPFSEISRTNSSPTAETFKLAQQLCEYAKRTHEDLVFKGTVKCPVLLCWCDASFEGDTGRSRMGYEIQLLDESEIEGGFTNAPTHNVIAWQSKSPARIVSSSAEVELLALEMVSKVVPFYSRVVERMWGVAPKEFYLTDNQAVLDWIQMRYVKSVARLQRVLSAVIDDFQEKAGLAQVFWVPTDKQRADKYTKFLSQEK
jgi:hypothetical protein